MRFDLAGGLESGDDMREQVKMVIDPAGRKDARDSDLQFAALLLRAKDRDNMLKAFDLWNYEDVAKHAAAILAAVESGKMPCDGPWPDESVQLVDRWIKGGASR